jgi:hypothetical protein
MNKEGEDQKAEGALHETQVFANEKQREDCR